MQVLGDGQTIVKNAFSHGDTILFETISGHFQFGVGERSYIVRDGSQVTQFGPSIQAKVARWLKEGGFERAQQELRETKLVHEVRKRGLPTHGILEQKAMKAGGNALLAQMHEMLDVALEKEGKSLDQAELAGFNPDEHPRSHTEPGVEHILPTIGEDTEYSEEMRRELEETVAWPPNGETDTDSGSSQENPPDPIGAEQPAPSVPGPTPDQVSINEMFLKTLSAMQGQLQHIQTEMASLQKGKVQGKRQAPKSAKKKAPPRNPPAFGE